MSEKHAEWVLALLPNDDRFVMKSIGPFENYTAARKFADENLTEKRFAIYPAAKADYTLEQVEEYLIDMKLNET